MARPKPEEFDELNAGNYICARKKKSIKIKEDKVKTIFESKVSPFSNSGGYISTSGDYKDHKVYVVVMEEKVE